MKVSWVISTTISVSLFTSCSTQPTSNEDNTEKKIELSSVNKVLEDEKNSLFHQDRNKSYFQIDRPWVLAKPLLEFNKSNSLLLKDE
jgi:hypothetical protein